MPELPEVEVVRRGLVAHVAGRTVATVSVHSDRAVRRHPGGAADFRAVVPGHRVEDVRRRGKYLWFAMDSGDAVLAHLGMSGQFRLNGSGPDGARGPDHVHLRVRWSFTDGGPDLDFVDQRTFGGLQFVPGGADLPDPVRHIARDPLDPGYDQEAVVAAVRRRRTEIKRALLDQTVVSGIGNIYADEALWLARLHYARRTEALTRPDVRRVLVAATEVMTAALAAGGTSFDSLYVNVNGESGYFERSLHAYGRQDEPCDRCGTPIRRDAFMNRSSFYCPRCQRRPRS
ncbi:bifunctional DNA-formamidopyrimidine glycosylase/DNA-(apurinic or apyrimidinic site) lyase [Nakamurella endophytica]|uniref:Formamidopyrimidine-DNA glycosylase n=1 Tax=Nakamurella endophytica TaxID=1748367 RepID=A0A917T2H4_9ACTN|nr:bifunctional DNA-formamidopyrimidine glycosylase/DNA-(apurinic or apyrimidinic site) lyase [Nakamurella endophytica]GGM06481.1 formamidopyrimidine-DNA glycosylase [Nakamurella endophytica]